MFQDIYTEMSFNEQFIQDSTPLRAAIEAGNELKEIKRLLSLGFDVNAAGQNEKPPLHLLVETGSGLDVIDLLLSAGADVNATDALKETALCCAVRRGRGLEVIKALLSAGGDVSCQVNGTTMLHKVCRADVARELLSRGLNINAENSIGQTPLHSVLFKPPREDTLELVQELLKHGANVNARDCCGFTPLHVMITSIPEISDLAIVKELLRFGGYVNARDSSGRTPLYHVMELSSILDVKFENIELVRMLVSHGGDINIRCGFATPLEAAQMQCNMFWVKLLIKVALMKNLNSDYKTVVDLDPHSISSNKELVSFFNNCVAELRRMDHCILNNNISLYDFLIKCDRSRNIIPLHWNSGCLEEEIIMNYPLYGGIILPQLRVCVDRAVFLHHLRQLQIYTCVENINISLVSECILNIAEYLSNSDIAMLITAYSLRSG